MGRCAVCGRENAEGARFCAGCGAPLAGAGNGAAASPAGGAPSISFSPASATQADPSSPSGGALTGPSTSPAAVADPVPGATAAPAPAAAPAPSTSRGQLKRRIGIVALVLVIIGVPVAGGVNALINHLDEQRQETEATATHPISLIVSAENLDTKTGTKVPVRVVGTTKRGDKLDEVRYAGSGTGGGIALAPGSYTLTVPASPIAADGTLYDVADAKAEVTVTTTGVKKKPELDLPATDPLKVTDEQIALAFEYAEKGGASDKNAAEQLKSAATKKRDDAVTAKKEADAQAEAEKKQAEQKAAEEAAAARHFTTSSYQFDIPAYWVGRVTVQIDGDKATIYSKKYPARQVCWIETTTEENLVAGDIGTSQMGSPVSLGGGRMAQVWARRYAVMAASPDLGGGSTDGLSTAELDEITDLQTGGKLSYSANPSAFTFGEQNATSDPMHADPYIFGIDQYLGSTLATTIKAR